MKYDLLKVIGDFGRNPRQFSSFNLSKAEVKFESQHFPSSAPYSFMWPGGQGTVMNILDAYKTLQSVTGCLNHPTFSNGLTLNGNLIAG